MHVPVDLKNMYKTGRLVPFIGAGASMSVTWSKDGTEQRAPSWREMVNLAIEQMGISPPELLRARGTDLQILEYFKLVNHGVAPLTNQLFARLQPSENALQDSKLHEALAALDQCRVFYTTNYDDFLERAFKLHGRKARVVDIEAHMGSRNTDTEIVKFHGDFNFPSSMVLTESDYEQRLKLQSPLDYRLSSDLLGRGVLFIGYSFSDYNISYLFRLVNEQFQALPETRSGRRAYIVVADPSDFEIRLFQSRNIEILPVSGKSRTEDIVKILQEIRR